MNTSTYSPYTNKCGVPSVGQFDNNSGQHLIVKYLREYKISITK